MRKFLVFVKLGVMSGGTLPMFSGSGTGRDENEKKGQYHY